MRNRWIWCSPAVGVKFIGLVGAIVALMDAGYSIKKVSGVSAGSIVAAILAAGTTNGQLTGEDVKELAFSVPVDKWRDAGPVPLLGAGVGAGGGTPACIGGDVAYDWIRSELTNLGVTSFGDLLLDEDTSIERRRYKLVVTVADLTAAQLVRLPWDYRRLYGLDPDEQPVAEAVRASDGDPVFLPTGQVDRGEWGDSHPGRRRGAVELSDRHLRRPDGKPPRWPTFGITVLPRLNEGLGAVMPALKPLRFFEQTALLEGLLTTMLTGHDQTHLNQPWVSARAIAVESTNVGVLDFDIARGRLDELYDKGYEAAREFLSTWDWQMYLKRFRWAG